MDRRNLVAVEIRNWQGGSQRDLESFILRKTHTQLKNVVVNGPVLVGHVSADDGRKLVGWSGVKFAGSSLNIKCPELAQSISFGNGGNSATNSSTKSTIEALTTFLQSRYNPQAKLLDLQNLAGDSILQGLGGFTTTSTASKMFPALMKIASNQSWVRDVESVSLAANGLQDVSGISTLAQTYPDLKNLSLADNLLPNVGGLESLRHKLNKLRELVLTNNPITASPTYKDDILKMFRRLVVLDGIVIRDEAQLNVLKLPLPVKHFFFQDDNVQHMASQFLVSYLQLFDQDRTQLMQLYDNDSTFSLSINQVAPHTANHTMGAWSSYIPLSRNLTKISASSARVNRLAIGQTAIMNTFRRMPFTTHQNLVTNPEKFAVDVWMTGGIRAPDDLAMTISVHGEFIETQNSNQMRSFDRTFLVLQAPSGNMIIASEIMSIRHYSGSDGWKETPAELSVPPMAALPGPAIPAGPSPVPSPNLPPELSGLSVDQISLVQRLMLDTKLNVGYAVMCMQQAGFDYAQALALFQQSQAQLPPEAYQ